MWFGDRREPIRPHITLTTTKNGSQCFLLVGGEGSQNAKWLLNWLFIPEESSELSPVCVYVCVSVQQRRIRKATYFTRVSYHFSTHRHRHRVQRDCVWKAGGRNFIQQRWSITRVDVSPYVQISQLCLPRKALPRERVKCEESKVKLAWLFFCSIWCDVRLYVSGNICCGGIN